jgi:PAS domain S-box-containing protein
MISSAIQEVQRERSENLDLRALIDASDDAIIGTDINGTILSWNKGAEKITGYKAEEILGRPVSVFVPPDRFPEHTENLMRLRRGEHIERFETIRIHKDGHPVDVSITISPIKGRGGVVVGASVVARDTAIAATACSMWPRERDSNITTKENSTPVLAPFTRPTTRLILAPHAEVRVFRELQRQS